MRMDSMRLMMGVCMVVLYSVWLIELIIGNL